MAGFGYHYGMNHKEIIKKAGGTCELARQLGITTASISGWSQIPATRVIKISQLSGIPPEKIRPDVFGV